MAYAVDVIWHKTIKKFLIEKFDAEIIDYKISKIRWGLIKVAFRFY